MATLSLAAILAESARRHPDKAGLVEGELRVTFQELWLQARKQAAALIGLGVRPGDKVALMAPNVAEFPRAYYAAPPRAPSSSPYTCSSPRERSSTSCATAAPRCSCATRVRRRPAGRRPRRPACAC